LFNKNYPSPFSEGQNLLFLPIILLFKDMADTDSAGLDSYEASLQILRLLLYQVANILGDLFPG